MKIGLSLFTFSARIHSDLQTLNRTHEPVTLSAFTASVNAFLSSSVGKILYSNYSSPIMPALLSDTSRYKRNSTL